MPALHKNNGFEKDYKQMFRRGYDLKLLQKIVLTLQISKKLATRHRKHTLSGNLEGFRECHILNDWLLMYKQTETDLYFMRTGRHSDLF